MFNEREVRISTALTVAAWIVTLIALLLVWLTEDMRVGFTTVVILGGAACLTIRETVTNARHRLWNAFDLGRDAASSSPVRKIRQT